MWGVLPKREDEINQFMSFFQQCVFLILLVLLGAEGTALTVSRPGMLAGNEITFEAIAGVALGGISCGDFDGVGSRVGHHLRMFWRDGHSKLSVARGAGCGAAWACLAGAEVFLEFQAACFVKIHLGWFNGAAAEASLVAARTPPLPLAHFACPSRFSDAIAFSVSRVSRTGSEPRLSAEQVRDRTQ
jgi:hypothetical protein